MAIVDNLGRSATGLIVTLIAPLLRAPFYLYVSVVSFLIFFSLGSVLEGLNMDIGLAISYIMYQIFSGINSVFGFIILLVLSHVVTKLIEWKLKRKLNWADDQKLLIGLCFFLNITISILVGIFLIAKNSAGLAVFVAIAVLIVLSIFAAFSLLLYEGVNLLERHLNADYSQQQEQ